MWVVTAWNFIVLQLLHLQLPCWRVQENTYTQMQWRMSTMHHHSQSHSLLQGQSSVWFSESNFSARGNIAVANSWKAQHTECMQDEGDNVLLAGIINPTLGCLCSAIRLQQISYTGWIKHTCSVCWMSGISKYSWRCIFGHRSLEVCLIGLCWKEIRKNVHWWWMIVGANNWFSVHLCVQVTCNPDYDFTVYKITDRTKKKWHDLEIIPESAGKNKFFNLKQMPENFRCLAPVPTYERASIEFLCRAAIMYSTTDLQSYREFYV